MRVTLAKFLEKNVGEPTSEYNNDVAKNHPTVGKLGGWCLALIETAEGLVISSIGIIESIVMSVINLIGSIFDEDARGDLKSTCKKTWKYITLFVESVFAPITRTKELWEKAQTT